MTISSVNVGDIVKDTDIQSGSIGVVETVLGSGAAACMVVSNGLPLDPKHGVMKLLPQCEMVQAAGSSSATVNAPTVVKATAGNLAYILPATFGTIVINDTTTVGGANSGNQIFAGAMTPNVPIPLNLTTSNGIVVSVIGPEPRPGVTATAIISYT